VVIASIGFAFDIYELLMLPLVGRDAIMQLTGASPGSDDFQMWLGRLFYIPALLGGLFGLLGGYLTDALGRRRVLTWSIMLYALSAFASGYATSIWMLLGLRCLTFIGVCVEFVAAVAWLAELFPNPRQRENVLGYTQAFSSFGGLLVAVASNTAALLIDKKLLPTIELPAFLSFLGEIPSDQTQVWRWTLMSGLIPAIPLVLIRPFLPESPAWARKKAEGTLKRPSIIELFAPAYLRTTIVTTLMFACSYGAAFGAIQQINQIVPGLAEVPDLVAKNTEGPTLKLKELKSLASSQKGEDLEATKKKIAGLQKQIGGITAGTKTKLGSEYTKMQEIGGLIGRFLLAIIAVHIVSRRALLRLFQVPALILLPLVFWYFLEIPNQTYYTLDLEWLLIGKFPISTVSLLVMLSGLVVVAQFSFWGNYLPLVYPLHLRGTGESFAANIGGRMIGTMFAYVTTTLAVVPKDSSPVVAAQAMAHTAALVALGVTLAGSLLCFFLPEPPTQPSED
jgi:MFS family permease